MTTSRPSIRPRAPEFRLVRVHAASHPPLLNCNFRSTDYLRHSLIGVPSRKKKKK